MIPGTFAIISGGGGRQASLTASRSSTAVTSSYAFTSVPLGVYDPTRLVVVSVHWYRYDTSSALNSVTIGSTSTGTVRSTSRLVTGGSGSYVYCALRSAAVTGTSATISLSFSTSLNYGCAIGVWSIYGLTSQTPVGTDTADTTGLFALSAQPDDIILAAATGVYDQTSASWANASENYDIINSRMISTGAQAQPLVAGDPGVDFNMSYASNAIPVGVAAVWR